MFKIKDGTIFIADSHYSAKRSALSIILKQIKYKRLLCNKLIFMGDIFDFLSNDIQYFIDQNQEIIDMINDISLDMPIIYFEGNHDFNLINFFPNIITISRKQQPISIRHNNKIVKLAHGDIYTPFLYNMYTATIRNKILLKILNFIDINNWLTKIVEKLLENKSICKRYTDLNKLYLTRIYKYKADLVIEGHFHQNILKDDYINIPSFFCDEIYLYYEKNRFYFKKLEKNL